MKVRFEDLAHLRHKHEHKTTVFMGGVFDLVHRGHIERLIYAREQGEVLFVGIASDESVRNRKGDDRPVQSEEDRLTIMNAMAGIDYAFIMPEVKDRVSPTMQVLQILHPSLYIESSEYKQAWGKDSHKLRDLGVQLVFDPGEKSSSTSLIIAKIRRMKN